MIIAMALALSCQTPTPLDTEFVKHLREREVALRHALITTRERSSNGSSVLIRELVEIHFCGANEKWVTRCQRDRASDPGEEDAEWSKLQARAPSLFLCMGGRPLKFTPHDEVSKSWLGTRFGEARRDHRRGLVLAGLMFAGRWLSECVTMWPPADPVPADLPTDPANGPAAGDAPTLRLVFDKNQADSTHRELLLTCDPQHGYFPVRTRLLLVTHVEGGGEPRTETTMETVARDLVRWHDVWLPRQAEVITYYGQEVHTAGTLTYDAAPDAADAWLRDGLPREVADADGAVALWDELTRTMTFAGNERIVAELKESLRSHRADRANSGRRGSMWIWLVAAASAIVLGVIAGRLLTSRAVHAVAGLALASSLSIVAACAEPACAAVRVSPGTHLSMANLRQGEIRRFEYDITNCSAQPITLAVLAKSCECVGVRLPEGQLKPGASTHLVAEAGLARGATTLAATILLRVVAQPGGADLGTLRLTLGGTGGSTPGLQLAPHEVTLTRSELESGFVRDFDMLIVLEEGQALTGAVVAEVLQPTSYDASVDGLCRLDARRWTARVRLGRAARPGADLVERVALALRAPPVESTEHIDVRILD